jgi:hypothetical protein
MTPALEPVPTVATTDPFPIAEVPEPSLAVEVLGSSPTAEVADSSSARGAVTVEEVMELATCRYIDFPGIGVIDLEAPQLPEKVLEVATKRMFAETTIMETIASVSKALHEYERAGGFAPHAAPGAPEAVPEVPTAGMEPAVDASALLPTSESREAPLPQPAEAVKTAIAVAATSAVEVVVGEAGSLPSLPVVTEVEPDEPTAVVLEQVVPEGTTRAASTEIQEAEETGASLPQGVEGGKA